MTKRFLNPISVDNQIMKILTFDCCVKWTKVVGVPDERLGEEICAWIRCKPQTILDSLELKNFCSEKVKMY